MFIGEISVIVDDVKFWASSRNWFFDWIPRSENVLAHLVASSALKGNLLQNWMSFMENDGHMLTIL